MLSFSGTTNFINNLAVHGGAIYTSYNTLLSFREPPTLSTIPLTLMVVQSTHYTILYLASVEPTTLFINNSAYFNNIVLNLSGTNNFINNSAPNSGGAISADNTVVSFNGTSHFNNNSALDGGAIVTKLIQTS